MKKQNIPITVRVPDQENGCCYCLVEVTGERTFLSLHGAEYTFQKSWMAPYPASNYDLTYVCGLEIEEPTGIQLIEYLEEHRELTVCYAPGPRGVNISQEKNSRIMALHPILHVNEQEALALSGRNDLDDAACTLRQKTENTVIITSGAKGAFCLEKNGDAYTVPSVPVTKIGDTIGAGDAHIGTILACLTMDLPLSKAIAYANQVSAAVVSVHGASLPPEALPPLL